MTSALRQQAAALPFLPGVYLFKNEAGQVLYVGKAVRLRERVRSYFAKEIGRGPGIDRMVSEAVSIDHQIAGSEIEALLLEARLIRQYKPRYNIRLRDDKSFSLIRIDLSEPFPPIYISREKELEELLVRRKRERTTVSKVSQKIDNQEFFGPYLSAGSVKLALKTIRKIWPFRDCSQGKYDTYAKLGHGCLFATLKLCDAPCAAGIGAEEYRKNIDQIRMFLRGDRQQVLQLVQAEMERCAAEERFEQAAKLRDRLQSLLHIQDVAETRRFIGSQQRSDVYRYDPETDIRVECYDISNIQGAYAVGSQITGVIRQGKVEAAKSGEEARRRFYLDKSRYRKYRIKTVEGISDVDMLKEVLTRRLKRVTTGGEHWALPDLILLDGGKGQLHAALETRSAAKLEAAVAMAAVAKGPTRRRVDLCGNDFDRLPLVSPEAWKTVAELLREEAHRFAISYYRRVHRRSALES
ncbi:UvrB/UvrC motif-containing protein [Patescibacteria group bacterium]|nr:UvrB/UvrC motif-containing protein [Patescibacteria group bacterium]